MPSIDERYLELHPKSSVMSQEAEDLFPDGVTHDGRKSGPFRVYMDHGKGPRKWGIDGTERNSSPNGLGSKLKNCPAWNSTSTV